MGVSKVVYGNQTLIDISGDTVTPETLMNGYTAHDASGAAIVGNASGGGGDLSKYVTAVDAYGEPIGVDDFSFQITNPTFNKAIVIGDNVTNCVNMFRYASSFNNSVTFGNNVSNCANMFYSSNVFNQPVDLPDSVTSCAYMFQFANNYNQPLTIPSNVSDLRNLFYGVNNYNKPVTIEATAIRTTNYMFNNCRKFNQPLSLNFNESNATTYGMFENCIAFNQPIQITGNLYIGTNMFNNCTSFNQPLSINIHISLGSSSFAYMFSNCRALNSPITFNVVYQNRATQFVTMEGVFASCVALNSPVTLPDCNMVNSVAYMFNNCTSFNQTINFTSNAAYYYYYMFHNCSQLNQDMNFKFMYNGSSDTSNMFRNALNVGGDFYFSNGNSHTVRNMFFNSGVGRRKNCYCDTLTRFLWTNTSSIVGQTITWTAMDNGQGYYNDSFNIYLYNQW